MEAKATFRAMKKGKKGVIFKLKLDSSNLEMDVVMETMLRMKMARMLYSNCIFNFERSLLFSVDT